MSEITETEATPQNSIRKNDAGAFVGLGLVAAGFALALIPLWGVIGWPLMLAGLILGIIGAAKKWQPMWANIVNIALGFAGPILAIVLVSAGLLAGAGAVAERVVEESEPAVTQEAEKSGEAEEEAPGGAEDAEENELGVTIDSARTGTDYSGDPILIVTYTFTNTSDEARNFMFTFSDQAFQNGIELDRAISRDVDSSAKLKDIKPGATIEVQVGYELDDESDVTVELTKSFDFSNTIIASKVFTVN